MTRDELRALSDADLEAEITRLGAGVEDATAALQELFSRGRSLVRASGVWLTTAPIFLPPDREGTP